MPFTPSDKGADEGRFLPRGLLASEGEWTLPLGVSQLRVLRHVAQAGLGLSAALLAFCVITLFLEARSGQGAWLKMILAGLCSLAWAMMAWWPMWRSLGQVGTVSLRWGGLPPFKPQADEAAELPGWSRPDHQQAVAVHVVFDLGPWLLIKIEPNNGQAAPGAVWCWLNGRVFFADGAGHQLRALLFNRRANRVGSPQAGDGVDPPTVASSRNPQRQWPNLLPSSPNPLQVAGQHAHHADKAFADTVIDERRIRA